VVLLANEIDYNFAAEFSDFLNDLDFEVVRSTASEFNDYKDEELIVILGGPDAPEGVGETVQAILTEGEADAIREPGAKKIYVKPNSWATGQKVIVLAGSDRNQTKAAHEENRESIISELDIQ
jgi:hypothetical protein